MKRIKVLIIIDWFLPGTASGGPVRSYANLIAQLNEGFEFYIITRDTDFGATQPYSAIERDAWNRLNGHTQVYYLPEHKINRRYLKTLLHNTTFDIAMVNGLYSWYFSILPVYLLRSLGKPILVSARGMLNPQAFSVKGFRKRLFLNLARVLKFYDGVTFHATNTDEAACIRRFIDTGTPIKIAPNLPRPIQPYQLKTKAIGAPVKMVNIARIAKEKGTLIMIKALQQVKQPLQVDLFGPIYDEAYWEQCQLVIEKLPSHICVSYKGILPGDEVPNMLHDYDFMVMLSEGENFGHAILEAFSAGCPVIISDLTPWRDLESKNIGWDVPIRDSEAVVKAFESALEMPPEIYELWSKNAYNFAKEFGENLDLIKASKRLFEV